MALKATIFKVTLNIADMDRHYYADHQLTLARHPSEKDERMMVRVLAFALNASEQLEFTRGLSSSDEPDLWQKSLSDEIELWIELGLPEESRLRKACSRSRQVVLYTYGARGVSLWWEKNKAKLARFKNLSCVNLDPESTEQLAGLAQRAMNFQVTIQDGEVTFSNEYGLVALTPYFHQG
ncbi:YaeQ family protein [Allohahella marinimesophila]|uniref:YaeQ family protein n=1 Tax=Allohahella marinimesophila TaxID=1054972 RepID=A0ABP7Q3J0_9GAMM